MRINNFSKFLLVLTLALVILAFPAEAKAAASLSFAPASQTAEVDQSFEVDIVLNTGGSNSDAADVIFTYDSDKLTLVSAVLGDLYENRVVTNTSVAGKVTLGATSTAGSYFAGTGTFATITFKGKAIGSAAVNFNFTASSTIDCNIAYAGQDILTSVNNGTYTIVAAGTLSATPTEALTPGATRRPQPTLTPGGFNLTLGLGFFGTLLLILGGLAILL